MAVKTRSQSRAISDSFSSNTWTFIRTNEQIIADHIDDYKVHNFEELNWVFNLSVGF